jgi:hypothetical protein
MIFSEVYLGNMGVPYRMLGRALVHGFRRSSREGAAGPPQLCETFVSAGIMRLVHQEIFEHRVAEGSAEERCHHRLSQYRAPLSPNQMCENSGHVWTLPFGARRIFRTAHRNPLPTGTLRADRPDHLTASADNR